MSGPAASTRADPPVVVRITPRGRWFAWRELWAARDLVRFLAWRDLTLRYRQTLLGVAWALLRPLATASAFGLVFHLLAPERALGTPGVSYALSCLCGLWPWQLFARGLTGASQSLVLNRALITKVYFPRVVPPLAAVVAAFADFAVAGLLVLGLLLVEGVPPSWWALTLPLWTLLAAATAFAAGLWLAVLNALYRDVGHALEFLVQLAMLVTPVVYTAGAVLAGGPAWLGELTFSNPMAVVTEWFRAALLGGDVPPWRYAAQAWLTVAVLGGAGWVAFRRLETAMIDRV